MSYSLNKRRIIRNSVTLYLRMMVTMVLNLLTTRFVLAALGVDEMGVYGVVGSIVSIFTVFIGGLLSATQRFVTFEMGKPNGDVHKVFNTSVNLILIVSVGLLILLEFGGIWMLECNVNIPEQSMYAARWVLQFSILTCMLNFNSTAYSAILIAHERMGIWAMISIIQVMLTCGVAYSLTLFQQSERLAFYAALMFAIQIIVQLMYVRYCKKHFPETHFQAQIDKSLVREMAKYAGASTVSGFLQMVIAQGIVLIINWTYGVAINAVYNIGMQVKNSVLSFGMNIFKSVSPQITKTYAAGEYDSHCKLVYSGSKMGVYMIMLILIPFVLRCHQILELWLGYVPPYTSAFAIALVFQALLYSGFCPFNTSVIATGNVTKYLIYSEIIHAFVLPTSYASARLFETPVVMVVVIVFMEFVYCGSMVWFGTRVSPVKITPLIKNIILPVMFVGAVSMLLCYLLSSAMPFNILGLIGQLVIGNIIIIGSIYTVGINSVERKMIQEILSKLTGKQLLKKIKVCI